MPKVRMTAEWLRRPPLGEWGDAEHPGLWLRVYGPEKRTWTLRYSWQGTQRRLRLGRYSDALGLSAARKLARLRQAEIDAGRDPQQERREARAARKARSTGATVGSAVRKWLRDRKGGPSARWKGGATGRGTARAFTSHISRLVRLHGGRLLADLDPAHIHAFVAAPRAASTRNHARTVVRGLLTWARRRQLLSRERWAILTEDVTREAGAVRKRVLSDAEIAILIRGYDATRYGRAVRFLLLTGLRREEVMGLRWEWVDLQAGAVTFPAAVDKSASTRGETYRAALSDAAVRLLEVQRAALFAEGLRASPWVFPTATGKRADNVLKPTLYKLHGRRGNGTEASKARNAKPRPVLLVDVTLHDIRRTVADGLLNRLEPPADPWIVDHVVLGHVRAKVLRTYMPTLPLGPAREALGRWAVVVGEILGEGVAAPGREGGRA